MTHTEQRLLELPAIVRVKDSSEEWKELTLSGDDDENSPPASRRPSLSRHNSLAVVEEMEATPPPAEAEYVPSECLPGVSADNKVAVFLENATLVVIVISVIGFYLETLPTYRLVDGVERTDTHPTFFWIETVCVAWFTIEYLVRWTAAKNKKRFPFHPMNIVDLIAILPYYISLGVGSGDASSLAVIRILRLSRVSRVFKFSRHSQGLQDMITCISATTKELILFLLITSVSTVLFASAEFYVEKDADDTGFISIPGM